MELRLQDASVTAGGEPLAADPMGARGVLRASGPVLPGALRD